MFYECIYIRLFPQLNSSIILRLAGRGWRVGSALCDYSGMRSRVVAVPSEIGDFADEVRRVFLELGRVFGVESLAGECSPPIDIYETDAALEITVDLPGVTADAVRIMGKGDTILIVGEKMPRRAGGDAPAEFATDRDTRIEQFGWRALRR